MQKKKLKVIRPDLVRHSSEESHDESIWTCLCQILRVHNDESDAVAEQTATIFLGKILFGSQSGPGAGVALFVHFPIVLVELKVLFCVVPAPPSSPFASGRPFDAFGHHRAGCSKTGERR